MDQSVNKVETRVSEEDDVNFGDEQNLEVEISVPDQTEQTTGGKPISLKLVTWGNHLNTRFVLYMNVEKLSGWPTVRYSCNGTDGVNGTTRVPKSVLHLITSSLVF